MKVFETSETYHSNEAKGSTFFKKIHSKTLLHALKSKQESTDSLVIGSALHCAILEPERFEKDFIIIPEKAPKKPSVTQRNAKKPSDDTLAAIAWWDDFEASTKGKTILDEGDMEIVRKMSNAVLSHPIASVMLSNGEAEYSYYVTDEETGINLKCRPDYHNGGTLIDIKTTMDASPKGFANQAGKLGYHLQAALYTDVFNKSQGKNYKDFHIIAVENKEPYAVAVYRINKPHMESGHTAYRNALNVYSNYINEKTLTPEEDPVALYGYATEIKDLEIPFYHLDNEEE